MVRLLKIHQIRTIKALPNDLGDSRFPAPKRFGHSSPTAYCPHVARFSYGNTTGSELQDRAKNDAWHRSLCTSSFPWVRTRPTERWLTILSSNRLLHGPSQKPALWLWPRTLPTGTHGLEQRPPAPDGPMEVERVVQGKYCRDRQSTSDNHIADSLNLGSTFCLIASCNYPLPR